VPIDDVGAEDGEGHRPPPHPDDRLWRHPSELMPPPGVPATGRSGFLGRAPLWGALALAAGTGAGLVALVFVALGLRDRLAGDDAEPTADEVAVTPTLSSPRLDGDEGTAVGDTQTALGLAAERLAPAVVRVEGGTTGSGFVMRADGMVMTSAGLVERQSQAGRVRVLLGDGRNVTGAVVGSDPLTDVAVLDLPGDGYDTVVFADDISVDRGTMAAILSAVDEPSDSTPKMAAGALASSRWSLEREDLPPMNGLMQLATGTDPEARGGPVVDEQGQVLGLTTWSADDWSYATPIDVASKVANDLMATGSPKHCWLGIEGRSAKDSIDESDAATAGVVVTDVSADGPASAILTPDDVVVAIDGDPVPDLPSLITALLLRSPGDQVDVTYHHGTGSSLETVPITLDAHPRH
jgi:putative serine protease PepD